MNTVSMQPAPFVGIGDAAIRAQRNAGIANAQAAGDLRFQQKAKDRRGISRGRGQAAQAGIEGASAMANGLADMRNSQLQNNAYNSQAMLDSDSMREAYGQQLWNLQSGAAHNNAMAALQREQAMMDFSSGILRGLLG